MGRPFNAHALEFIMKKSQGNVSLARPKSRWEGTIEMDFKQTSCDVD
jgi:hypothetical protein